MGSVESDDESVLCIYRLTVRYTKSLKKFIFIIFPYYDIVVWNNDAPTATYI